MKKIFDKEKVADAVNRSIYREKLEALPVEVFLVEYEKGEFLTSAQRTSQMIQLVAGGTVAVYYIREDGSTYALELSKQDAILGDMEFFGVRNDGVFAEVSEKLTCIAIAVDGNKEKLLQNSSLLCILAKSLAEKLASVTMQNAAPVSLNERVYAYMFYKCENRILKGVENAAFHLHCSPRQLQRILNTFVENGIARKVGKGTYELIHQL